MKLKLIKLFMIMTVVVALSGCADLFEKAEDVPVQVGSFDELYCGSSFQDIYIDRIDAGIENPTTSVTLGLNCAEPVSISIEFIDKGNGHKGYFTVDGLSSVERYNVTGEQNFTFTSRPSSSPGNYEAWYRVIVTNKSRNAWAYKDYTIYAQDYKYRDLFAKELSVPEPLPTEEEMLEKVYNMMLQSEMDNTSSIQLDSATLK